MRALAIVALVIACAHGAAADGKQDARGHVQTADIDYKLGKFTEALDEYTKAYELFPAPALLFNIGQCHRNLKNYERAVFFYEGYLRESPPDAPNRALVVDLIRESKDALDKQTADEVEARRVAEAAREQAVLEEARLRAEAEARRRREEDQRIADARRAADLDRQRSSQTPRPRIYQRWWFWTAVGGAAAVAAGGTLYYFSGDTRVIPPSGSLGGLDRR